MKPKVVKVFKHGASTSIIIPKTICDVLEIHEDDFLLVDVKEDTIIMKKTFSL